MSEDVGGENVVSADERLHSRVKCVVGYAVERVALAESGAGCCEKRRQRVGRRGSRNERSC
jgi:hypothetical protein